MICSRICERDSRGWATSRTRSMMSARFTTVEPRRLPRVVEHRPQHARDLLDLRIDGPQPRAGPIIRLGVVADHLNVARHQVQRRAGLMGDVRGDLAQRRHALGTRQRFPKGEQLALAGCQLRVPKRQIASGLLDPLVKGLVEPLQLIEHVVQPVCDGAELVVPSQHRARAQIASRGLLHGPQDGSQRPYPEADGP